MITEHASKIKKYAPSWLYKLASQAWFDKRYPRHLFIETTAACNLNCSYCPREKIKDSMDFGLFTAILDEASRYGSRSFSLHLFGEPLLYPRMADAIRYIKFKNRRHVVLLTTNGTQLERLADEIVSLPIDQIFWTWRPEVKWKEKTKERLRKWGRFRVRFIEELTPAEAYREWSGWKNVERRKLHNYGEIELQKFGVQSTAGPRWPCYHLWLAPAVAWNGKFLMCCSDPHQKEVFGDINRESVSECWQRLHEIRKSHLEGKYSGICRDCNVWKQYPDMFFSWQRTI